MANEFLPVNADVRPEIDPLVLADKRKAADEQFGLLLQIFPEHVKQNCTATEERILRLRYGTEDGTLHTLDEIALILRISLEEVQRTEAAATKRMQAVFS